MRFKTFLLLIALLSFGSLSLCAQDGNAQNLKEDDKKKDTTSKNLSKGESIAESSIFIYSGGRGRAGLGQIRKSTVEIGKITIVGEDGKEQAVDYERRILRGDNLEKEKVRLDQKFPSAEYALVYSDDKVFGIFDNAAFTPREDAANSFQDQIWHGLDALLRYKENGSTVELEKEIKDMGVDYYVVNVTDKDKRKTTFYISKKSLRVMKIEYERGGVKYRRKFYNHNYAQGTLVPYRTVLWADGKQIEEKEIATVTYGQTVGPDLFEVKVP